MIREIYLDFIREKIARKDLGWLMKRSCQYLLTCISSRIGRPLCGPILGTFVTNYSCNYHCKMCDLPLKGDQIKKSGLKELSTVELKRLLKDFTQIGVSGIGFTGGEPLLRSDIFELLAYAKSLRVITHLNTNGFLMDDKNTEAILKSGVDSISISLDGATSQTHDKIRGYPGAFDRVVTAINTLNLMRGRNKHHIRLKVAAVINEENIDEVEGLVKLSADLKTDCLEFIPQQHFSGSGPPKNNLPSEEFLGKINKAVDYLLQHRNNGIKIENSVKHLKIFERSFRNLKSPLACYAGYNSCALDCYGQIYPCVPWVNWGKAVGNIRNMPLKEFWHSRSYASTRKEIAQCRDCYLNCQSEINILFNPAGLLN